MKTLIENDLIWGAWRARQSDTTRHPDGFARLLALCLDLQLNWIDHADIYDDGAVEALHGDMSQPARERVLQRLRAGGVELVVCTDIAARGIDVDHITQVVNLDLPENSDVYVHRIGRTGRAGRTGRSVGSCPGSRGTVSRLTAGRSAARSRPSLAPRPAGRARRPPRPGIPTAAVR